MWAEGKVRKTSQRGHVGLEGGSWGQTGVLECQGKESFSSALKVGVRPYQVQPERDGEVGSMQGLSRKFRLGSQAKLAMSGLTKLQFLLRQNGGTNGTCPTGLCLGSMTSR